MSIKPFTSVKSGNYSAAKGIVAPNQDKVLPSVVKEERTARYNPFTNEKEYFDITKILPGLIKDEKPNIPKLPGIIY